MPIVVATVNVGAAIAFSAGMTLVRWLVDTFALPGDHGPGGDRATEVSVLLVGILLVVAGALGLMVGNPEPTVQERPPKEGDGVDGFLLGVGVIWIALGVRQVVRGRQEPDIGRGSSLRRFAEGRMVGGAMVAAGIILAAVAVI